MAANPPRRNNRDRNGPNNHDPTEEGYGDFLAKQLELPPPSLPPTNLNNLVNRVYYYAPNTNDVANTVANAGRLIESAAASANQRAPSWFSFTFKTLLFIVLLLMCFCFCAYTLLSSKPFQVGQSTPHSKEIRQTLQRTESLAEDLIVRVETGQFRSEDLPQIDLLLTNLETTVLSTNHPDQAKLLTHIHQAQVHHHTASTALQSFHRFSLDYAANTAFYSNNNRRSLTSLITTRLFPIDPNAQIYDYSLLHRYSSIQAATSDYVHTAATEHNFAIDFLNEELTFIDDVIDNAIITSVSLKTNADSRYMAQFLGLGGRERGVMNERLNESILVEGGFCKKPSRVERIGDEVVKGSKEMVELWEKVGELTGEEIG